VEAIEGKEGISTEEDKKIGFHHQENKKGEKLQIMLLELLLFYKILR